jgi:hypothetical protein
VRPRQAWFKGDASFIPNTANGIGSIGSDPIMFNGPEEVVDAIYRAAKVQGVTLFDARTKEQLANGPVPLVTGSTMHPT